MLEYLSDEAKMQYTSEDDYIYELKSIIIHSGGGTGGHYTAYIKDDLGEGNWYLEESEGFDAEPTEIIKKKVDPKDFMTKEEIEEQEAEESKGKNQEQNNKRNNKKKNK